ncbi:hypothetical protein L195_g021555, partial [Trifolium pratense]
TPVALSSDPNEDTITPVIDEQPTATTMQDPPQTDQTSKEKKKKKKDKKAKHQASHEEGHKESEAKEEASKPYEDPPKDQSEKKKKKKKHKKTLYSTTPVATHTVEADMPKASETGFDSQVQPQNSPKPALHDDPSPTKVVKDVVEELNVEHQDTTLEKTLSPKPVKAPGSSKPSSPKPTGSPHRDAETTMPNPNNEDAILGREQLQGSPPATTTLEGNGPPLVQEQMQNPNEPVMDDANAAANQDMGVVNEQSQPLEGEHSTTNQPQPSGTGHRFGSIDTNEIFDSDDDDAQTGDSLDGEGTSVSKPPPSTILPAEIVRELKDLAPEDALSKLLSNHGTSTYAAEDKENYLSKNNLIMS